jgi:chromatin modification-related protein EAF6
MKDSPGFSSSHTTPSHAPTPINTSFIKHDASNNATPTSATSANKSGAGLKKTIKKSGEDSETDTKDGKKRTNFGVSRK